MLSKSTLEQLEQCESMLLWPAPGTSVGQIEALLAAEFQEIGASGRRLGRNFGIDTLLERRSRAPQKPWVRSETEFQEVSAGVVLITYRLQHDRKTSLRSTLCRHRETHRETGSWEAVFHQGTAVSGYSLSESSGTA